MCSTLLSEYGTPAETGETRVSRVPVGLVGSMALVGMVLGAGAPAWGQAGPPTVSIAPTAGPIGTEITATVANCTPPREGGDARLDFTFEGLTPANSEFFDPDAGGNATVTIEVTEKEGQSEGLTAAEVMVSQCGNGGVGSAPFTVTRSPVTTTTTTTTTPDTSTTTSTSTSTTSTTTATTSTTAPVVTEPLDSTSLRPPSAVLRSPAGEVEGLTGSYCWTGGNQGLCVDAIPPEPADLPLLKVSRGAALSVAFGTTDSPTEALLFVTSAGGNEQRFDLAAANPTHLSSSGLDPDVYVLALFTRWDSGDASYFFKVQVDADRTAPPTSMVRAPSSEGRSQIPATGSEVVTMAGAGAAMISMGAVMLLVRPRKGHESPASR